MAEPVAQMDFRSSTILRPVSVSRLPVGSSARIMSGRFRMARAITMRLIGSYMAYAFYNGGQIQRWQAESCWKEENPDKWAEYPRLETLNMNDTNLQTSDYWVRNASFLRVKNIQIGIGYTLPFETFAAEWIDADKLKAELDSYNLPKMCVFM